MNMHGCGMVTSQCKWNEKRSLRKYKTHFCQLLDCCLMQTLSVSLNVRGAPVHGSSHICIRISSYVHVVKCLYVIFRKKRSTGSHLFTYSHIPPSIHFHIHGHLNAREKRYKICYTALFEIKSGVILKSFWKKFLI